MFCGVGCRWVSEGSGVAKTNKRRKKGRREGGREEEGEEEKEIDERTVDDALALLDGAPADADEAVDAARDLARDLVRAEAGEVLACLYIVMQSPVNVAWIRSVGWLVWFGLRVWVNGHE